MRFRDFVPAPHRQRLKALALPTRDRFVELVEDSLADVTKQRSGGLELPPAALRRRVANNGSRSEFLEIGARLARDVLDMARAEPDPPASFGAVLDFGCGCGRVARHLTRALPMTQLVGVDVDGPATDWCTGHLPGRYLTIQPHPPLPLPDDCFDLVVCVSVFTHLSELAQFSWLAELNRVVKPGGRLVASTHAPDLLYLRPDLVPQSERLQEKGFLFGGGQNTFNQDTAFHSRDYMRREWSPFFELLDHRQHGLDGFQDLAVFRVPPGQGSESAQ